MIDNKTKTHPNISKRKKKKMRNFIIERTTINNSVTEITFINSSVKENF